jgi:hypothetical protein
VPLFGRKEDLHRRLVVVDFLFPSTHFLRSPQYPSTCAGQVFSKHFPKLPNERSIKRSSLSQSTFNEPTTHHFIKSHHHPKDSTKQRKRIFIVDSSSWIFFFLLRISYALPSILSPVAGQVFIKHFPKLPNEVPNHHHCLFQPSQHPLHIISSNPTIIQKTVPSKERGSSSSTRRRDFLRIPQYSFYLIHKQAFVTRHFIDRIPEVPKPSSLSPSTFKQSTTHHFIKSHHHNGGSLSGSLLRCRLARDPPPCRFLHLCNIYS